MFGHDPLNANVYSMILGAKYKKGLNANLGDVTNSDQIMFLL